MTEYNILLKAIPSLNMRSVNYEFMAKISDDNPLYLPVISATEQSILTNIVTEHGTITKNILFDNSQAIIPMRLCRHIIRIDDKSYYTADIYLFIEGDYGYKDPKNPIYTCKINGKIHTGVLLCTIPSIKYSANLSEKAISMSDYNKIYTENFHKRFPIFTDNLLKKLISMCGPDNIWFIRNIINAYMKYPNAFARYLPTTKHFPYVSVVQSRVTLTWEQLTETIKYVSEVLLHDRPDYKDYVESVTSAFYSVYSDDNHEYILNNDGKINISHKSSNTYLIDTLRVYTCCGVKYNTTTLYHPISITWTWNGKLNWYVANEWINISRVFDKYPDICSDAYKLGIFFDNIMPYIIRQYIVKVIRCKYFRQNIAQFVDSLITIGGLVGMWICTCEPGTGSNAWMLQKQLNKYDFIYAINGLLHGYTTYADMVIDLQLAAIENLIDPDAEDVTCNVSVDDKLAIIEDLIKLFNTPFDMSYIITWFKDFIKRYPCLYELSNEKYIFDQNIFIPSPSGFTFVPFEIVNW